MALARIPRDIVKAKAKPKIGVRPSHLAFVRSLPCIACGGPPPCHAAHVRMSRAEVGKANAMSKKPDDKFTLPLHERCHLGDQHSKYGEPEFWARLGIDPVDAALRLWTVTGDWDQGVRTIERARQRMRLASPPNAL